jgi:hypothetical protein
MKAFKYILGCGGSRDAHFGVPLQKLMASTLKS